jgi:non-canonical poly(A) RNA polymerase PAPD5/7
MARTKKSKPGNRAKGDKMPRPPPLPPGLPPRPAAPRGDVSGGDSYRPREPSSPGRRDAPGQSGGMYHFRGAASAPGTSYRPSYDDQRMRSPPRLRSPPRYNDSGFRPAYDSPARDDYHSYRPTYNDNRDRHDRGDRNEGFTFRQELPPNIDFDQAHKYRARSPRRQREYESGDSYRANNRANTQRGGLRGGYRGRGGPRMASERDFLKTNRAKTPELMPGMDIEQGNITYKDVDNMSDSDEAEMDLSNSDEEADDDQPRKKQKTTTDSNSVPRWSNPDPYTVLPPPDATDRKKKDVVKLIRKARVTSGLENATKTVADTDDFISFGFDEDDKDDTQTQSGIGVEGAPTGPRSSGFQNLPPSPENSLKTAPSSTNYQQLPPLPPGLPNKPKDVMSNKKTSRTIDLTMDPNLGTRKRTRNDVLKPPPQIHGPTPGKGASKPEGNIVKAWKPLNGVTPTPWIALDHSNSANFGVW